jgi:hypothetical protein
MFEIHRHHYEEKERHYAMPLIKAASMEISQHTMAQYLFGVTTIVLRCAGCGRLQTVEVKGDATKKPQPKAV